MILYHGAQRWGGSPTITTHRQNVPLDLWLNAESVEDWRSKVATYRK